jgi:hypothetical protein
MSYTATWDESQPLGSAAANSLDTIIQGLKRDLRERANELFEDFTTDPAVPKGPVVLGRVVSDVTTGGVTTEVTLHTISVPANKMGTDRILRITAIYDFEGTNDTKTLRVRLGGTFIGVVVASSVDVLSGMLVLYLIERSGTAAQLATGWAVAVGSTAIEFLGVGSKTIDTTVANDLTITGQTANAGDTITAYTTIVEIM